jgi:hypothetical protein
MDRYGMARTQCITYVAYENGDFFIFKYEGMTPPGDFDRASSAYSFTYRAASSTANWIIYRLADIYLMKAEAITENNPTEDDLRAALELVNKTYSRATLEKDAYAFEDYSSLDLMKSLILKERRCEFAFEGKRWFDLLRKVRKDGNTTAAWNILSAKYGDNVALVKAKMSMVEAWYLPINQTQMNLSHGVLHQNAYYKTQEQN